MFTLPNYVPVSINKELTYYKDLHPGDKNKQVAVLQEWLCFHGFNLIIDKDYGPATKFQVKQFQSKNHLVVDAIVGPKTHNKLIRPMLSVLQPLNPPESNFTACLNAYGKQHLKIHPIEIGGQNKGPWVRLYMNGQEGNSYPWCAGFVSFLITQVNVETGKPVLIKGSISCDTLAQQAKDSNIFLEGKKATTIYHQLKPGALFLIRKSVTNWTHTGLVTSFNKNTFETIEGNTNDEGSREGYEVCARVRSYNNADFIIF